MKKFCYTFLLLFFITLPSSAFTLKGGVSYTVESARKEAFANVQYTLPQNIIDANRFDPNFQDNKVLIKNGVKETQDRYITYFSDGSYGIVYKKNLYYVYYYSETGKLTYIDKRQTLFFPAKAFKFNLEGKLVEVVIHTKNGDFVFFPNGSLKSHWFNNVEYDINGNIIDKRY